MRNAMTQIQIPSRHRQGGVMLLEVLIGILIFSIGILAMLGMQAIGMRNTVESKYRAEASYLANQIVGAMWVDRANPAGNLCARYDDAGAGAAANTSRSGWVNLVQQRLPQAATYTPSIVVTSPDCNKGGQVMVTVRWLRPGEDPGTGNVNVSRYVVIAQINGVD
jgi:type IV pilus assembly protein PilV